MAANGAAPKARAIGVRFSPRLMRLPSAVIIHPNTRVQLRMAETLSSEARDRLVKHLHHAGVGDDAGSVLDELLRDAEAAAVRWLISGHNGVALGLWPSRSDRQLLKALDDLRRAKLVYDEHAGRTVDILRNIDARLPGLISQIDETLGRHIEESVVRVGRGAPGANSRRTLAFAGEVLDSWRARTEDAPNRGSKVGSVTAFYEDLVPDLICDLPVELKPQSHVKPARLRLLKAGFADALSAALRLRGTGAPEMG